MYPIGTRLSKIFIDEEDGSERPFSGEVTAYDAKSKFYSILYEDGDGEEMEEADLSLYVVTPKNKLGAAGKRKKSPRKVMTIIITTTTRRRRMVM